jgi:pimeloyl-ACP methyl ester carboxylesterase
MKRPLFGVGHSMGGCQLVNLALLHPRLLESLILVDPVISPFAERKESVGPAHASIMRRDRWPSRKIALESFKRSPFYQKWDPRVLRLWVEYGLRELPTKLYPDVPPAVEPYESDSREVTLTTTKHQEVMTFLRFTDNGQKGSLEGFSDAEKEELKTITHPDYDKSWTQSTVVYRSEPIITFHNLPRLRPSVLYVFGETSEVSPQKRRTEKMAVTGIGFEGSGGVKAGRVKEVVVLDTGHLVPMERVGETARYCADWINSEMERFKRSEQLMNRFWNTIPEKERSTLSEKYVAKVRKEFETVKRAKTRNTKI